MSSTEPTTRTCFHRGPGGASIGTRTRLRIPFAPSTRAARERRKVVDRRVPNMTSGGTHWCARRATPLKHRSSGGSRDFVFFFSGGGHHFSFLHYIDKKSLIHTNINALFCFYISPRRISASVVPLKFYL